MPCVPNAVTESGWHSTSHAMCLSYTYFIFIPYSDLELLHCIWSLTWVSFTCSPVSFGKLCPRWVEGEVVQAKLLKMQLVSSIHTICAKCKNCVTAIPNILQCSWKSWQHVSETIKGNIANTFSELFCWLMYSATDNEAAWSPWPQVSPRPWWPLFNGDLKRHSSA